MESSQSGQQVRLACHRRRRRFTQYSIEPRDVRFDLKALRQPPGQEPWTSHYASDQNLREMPMNRESTPTTYSNTTGAKAKTVSHGTMSGPAMAAFVIRTGRSRHAGTVQPGLGRIRAGEQWAMQGKALHLPQPRALQTGHLSSVHPGPPIAGRPLPSSPLPRPLSSNSQRTKSSLTQQPGPQ